MIYRSDLITFSKYRRKKIGNRLIELYDMEQEECPDNIKHVSCSMNKFIEFMESSDRIFDPMLSLTTLCGIYASWKPIWDSNKLFSLHFLPNTIRYVLFNVEENLYGQNKLSGEIDIQEIQVLLENNSMNDVVYEMGT